MRRRFKLVTFDVTNTLLKLRQAPGQQYAKIGELHGVRADPVKLTASFNSSWKRLNVEHPNYGRHTGLDTSERWWSLLVQQTFSGAGHLLDSAKIKTITSNLIDIYRTEACWSVPCGVPELLRRLRGNSEKEITVGVISNFDEHLDKVLDRTELSQYFDFVLASYVANCYKPQVEIFELALRESGLRCRPDEAVHIGDDFQLDYVAARSAGWNSLLVSTSDAKPDVDPSFLMDDIRNVVDFIDGKSESAKL